MSELQANLAFRQGLTYNSNNVYPSYFKLYVRWLLSFTPVTYSSKLLEIMSLIRGSPYGPAQALFKMVYNQFVTQLPPSYNSNYFGYESI
ncbi:hypothetical protein YEP4_12276 [Yersinia enterocolitica subsp. palearctica YE-P4]|uniref:Uncharacterized protein n=1 Tax=Yersinia enterocolitica W22703 TaxID=913028 RepID=F4MVL0_YEREN|nr:hypothetical protein XM56_02540 [Yersinia enterocolitica]EHB19851.1 hypothetical protein IOK_15944 [Yersinia enterocolitica subsp. palearctica PhRBD_Ye1]EOR67411.1 hypothetical protein YE149_12376 [Yersinia enterocolitica subsp. palearctica YE-149]EOR75568.1 hypothetical protein YE150_12329 [Yersinia enterocolitica subsp. palearctica YE-150]EOR76262.1 hypothetical protein YEP1_12381 [Yersinia enterocolitica subsp. palearctica YE-P1]EOR80811.1 hypothetical protein YEP4_12276 [Yersinia entero